MEKGEQFEVGQVWLSPRGYFYKVMAHDGEQAIMRMGINGHGRKVKKNKYAVIGWSIHNQAGDKS